MTTVSIACDVSQPDGTEFLTARLEFALSGPDYDTAAGEAIPAVTTYVDLDASGVGTADLWPVDLGTRNTFYAVVLRGSVLRDGRTSEFVSTLGRVQPQAAGGQTLADLLAQSSGGIVVGSVIYDTLADAVAAAVAAGAAGADPVAAIAARDKAQEWAENPVDDPVETGQFSALHHAAKAALDRAAAELAAAAAALFDGPTIRGEIEDDTGLTYTAAQPGTVAEGDVVLTPNGFMTAAPASAPVYARANANGVKLNPFGRNNFFPEMFGAGGLGLTNDTAALNRWLRAIAAATATGPVRAYARGCYLTDELDMLSQYEAGDFVGLQQDSVDLDLAGAKFIHSGVGDGLLTLEGHNADRSRVNVVGGIFFAHSIAASKYAIRTRDLRGSLIQPEALLGFDHGVLAQIWRTWSENMTYGGDRTFEGRGCNHVMKLQGRDESWKWQIEQDGGPVLDVADYQGELIADPGAPASGDWYYNTVTNEVKSYTASWATHLTIDGVDASVSVGRSFARTVIRSMLVAAPADPTLNGQAVYIDGASPYDSDISFVRGNAANGGGSLFYLNDPFLQNTEIKNVLVEMASNGGAAVSYAIRTGPKYPATPPAVIRPPIVSNVHWTGGYAEEADPAAGVLISGERTAAYDLTAGVAQTILPAAWLQKKSTVRITVTDDNSNVLGCALVSRKEDTSYPVIADMLAQRGVVAFAASSPGASFSGEMTGSRFTAPSAGRITKVTINANSALSAGTATVGARIGAGDLNSTAGGFGYDATITTGEYFDKYTPSVLGRAFAEGNSLYALLTTDGAFAGPTELQGQIFYELAGTILWGVDGSNNVQITAAAARDDVRVFFEVIKG